MLFEHTVEEKEEESSPHGTPRARLRPGRLVSGWVLGDGMQIRRVSGWAEGSWRIWSCKILLEIDIFNQPQNLYEIWNKVADLTAMYLIMSIWLRKTPLSNIPTSYILTKYLPSASTKSCYLRGQHKSCKPGFKSSFLPRWCDSGPFPRVAPRNALSCQCR